MNKEQRVVVTKEFAGFIEGKALIFVDYCRINMVGFDFVRDSLYAIGAKIRVFKNTLLKRALSQSKVVADVEEVDQSCLVGMTATAVVDFDGFFASGKSLLEAERKKFVVIKGGIYEGKFLDAATVRLYGSLPSRDALYAELVGSLNYVLNSLVVTLDEVVEQKKEAEGTQSSADVAPKKEAEEAKDVEIAGDAGGDEKN